MRYIRALIIPALATFAFLTAIAPSEAQAETLYPWCAHYNGGRADGGINCGFVSYAQCMAAVSGVGGSCEVNLFYVDKYGIPQRAPRRR